MHKQSKRGLKQTECREERSLQSAASHDSLNCDSMDIRLAHVSTHVWGINSASIFKASESNAAAKSKD